MTTLIHTHKPDLARLCAQNKVKSLHAFGSVLTGGFDNDSDIDLVIEIHKDLWELVKAKAKREGCSIPTVAELYQAWVDGLIKLPPRDSESFQYPSSKMLSAAEWLADWEAFIEDSRYAPVADPRTCSKIIGDDRNRKVNSDPFYHPKNLAHLHKAAADYKAGRNFTEHELIEVEED